MADRQAQVLAHKSALDAVRAEADRAKTEELEAMKRQCDADLGMLHISIIFVCNKLHSRE